MRIVCICGAGVGSSLLVKMGIERVLARHGMMNATLISNSLISKAAEEWRGFATWS